MISMSFINGTQGFSTLSNPIFALEKVIAETDKEIEEAFIIYNNKRETLLFESEIMGSIDTEKELILEASGKNVFDKIGTAVLEVFKKIQDAIQIFINKIKDFRFRHKSYEKKLDTIKKQNPQYADLIMAKIDSGELKVTDLRGIESINKSYKEIIDMSKRKEVDTKTLRGKFHIFKEKVNDFIQSSSNTAKATTAIISLATAALTFKKLVLDAYRTSHEVDKMSKENYSAFLKSFEELQKVEDGKYVDPDALSKAEILKNTLNFWECKMGDLVSNDQKKVTKMSSIIESFIGKHNKEKASDYVSKLNTDLGELNSREAKEEKKASDKNKKDAREKAYSSEMGRLYAKHKWDISHPEELLKDNDTKVMNARTMAKAQRLGQTDVQISTDWGEVGKTAYIQQRARNSANKKDNKKNGTP